MSRISGRVYKPANSRFYHMILELTDPATGKRKPKWISTKCTRKRDAEAKLYETLAQYNRGEFVMPNDTTVAEILRRWIKEIAPLTASPRTCSDYETIIEQHLIPAFGALRIRDLTAEMIQAYYAKTMESGRLRAKRKKNESGEWEVAYIRTGEPLSSTSVRQHHIILRAALNQAVMWRLASHNPTDHVVAPRARKPIVDAWLREEARLFLQEARIVNSRYLPLYILALGTGMRQAELLGLRWCDVHLESGTITIQQTLEKPGLNPVFKEKPKTSSSRRTIDISESLVTMLREMKEERYPGGRDYRSYELVFAQESGLPYDPSNMVTRDFDQIVERLVEKHHIRRITFHGLRHTHATDLLRRGISPKIVTERLGHSSVAFTMDTYGHVLPGMQKEAAGAIDDMLQEDGE